MALHRTHRYTSVFLKRMRKDEVKIYFTVRRHFCVCQNSMNQVTFSKNLRQKSPQQLNFSRLLHASKCQYERRDREWLSDGAPDLAWDFLLNHDNRETIRANIQKRKGVGDINLLHDLVKKHDSCLEEEKNEIRRDIIRAACDIPNHTHPAVVDGDESHAVEILRVHEDKINGFDFKPKTVMELGEHLDTLRLKNISLTTGDNTFYLKGAFAMLERALINYTVDVLKNKGFRLISVPELLYPHIIESCGFKTSGQNQVYKLKPELHGDVCLAGTGEMPLAGFCKDKLYSEKDLPQKLMTYSQCFRAETSNHEHERGIYRVHQFMKVEMFGLTADTNGQESESFLEDLLETQIELFRPLGFPFRVLDMPSQELGAPAYRKYDIEAWMPGKSFWGEVSSASNCTDYQSRRLSAKYQDETGAQKFCHSLNGTACAVPRMIMAIAESNQQEDMTIAIPDVLQPYMNMSLISPPSTPVSMKPIKFSKHLSRKLK